MTIQTAIKKIVCDHFEIDERTLSSRSKENENMLHKHFFRFLLKKYSNMILKDIAEASGAEDHSCTINSVKKISDWCDSSRDIDLDRACLEAEVKKCLNEMRFVC